MDTELDNLINNLEISLAPYVGGEMKQRIWWTLHKSGVFSQDMLCNVGLHHFTNKPVGLLHAHCGNCKKRIQVADPYSYTANAGRNKYDENGFLTYD